MSPVDQRAIRFGSELHRDYELVIVYSVTAVDTCPGHLNEVEVNTLHASM